jgi:formate-dependent nitrite reductase membrane component NrfD
MIGEGRMAEQMVQVVFNAQHKVPWHWPVPAYLVTKGIAAGIFLILAAGSLMGLIPFESAAFLGGGFIALLMTVVTTALLVYDLEHPSRFLRIILRPQWKSWLVRGAFLLIGFSTIAGLWWVIEAAASLGWIDSALAEAVRPIAFGVGIPLAIGAAIYTAFLFGQAEGRDLWQSSLLPVHLIIQAIMAGAASMLLLAPFIDAASVEALSTTVFIWAVGADLLVMLFGEVLMPHASEVAAQAAHAMTHGRYKRQFWVYSIALGHVVPLAMMFVDIPIVAAIAGGLTLIGLYAYEYAFVMAPQDIPNS